MLNIGFSEKQGALYLITHMLRMFIRMINNNITDGDDLARQKMWFYSLANVLAGQFRCALAILLQRRWHCTTGSTSHCLTCKQIVPRIQMSISVKLHCLLKHYLKPPDIYYITLSHPFSVFLSTLRVHVNPKIIIFLFKCMESLL